MDARTKRIVDTFNIVERDYPKKSTEWLMAMTADKLYLLYKIDVDNGDIAAALSKAQD